MNKFLGLFLLMIMVYSCESEVSPKPSGFLALEYENAEYDEIQLDCPYSFDINKEVRIKESISDRACMLNLNYPKLDGTIYLTYEPVEDNIEKLLDDAQQLPLKHTIKADEIFGDEYENEEHHTYGMLYTITGNAASQAQFYLTDSVKHFVTGSLYFRRKPNYDSIYPAAEFLKDDMRRLMESLKWEEN